MARIDAFLKLGLAQGCSDIHLAVGLPPMLRLRGDLMPIKSDKRVLVSLLISISHVVSVGQCSTWSVAKGRNISLQSILTLTHQLSHVLIMLLSLICMKLFLH